MKIVVKKLSENEINKMGIPGWSIWEKEVSEFDWYYSEMESCYILEGDVSVKTDDGITSFKKGDFVVFPQGLKCVWKINKPVKKHFKFGQ